MKLSAGTQKTCHKWLVAAGCFLMIFLGLGFCTSNKSMYLKPITEALNFERSVFALNDSFRFLAQALVSMIFGAAVAKFGVRKLIIAGFACIAASLAINASASRVGWFYLAGALVGMGQALCTTSMVSYLVGIFFPEKRGTVIGIIMGANGVGAAISAQIIGPMIDDPANPFGFRTVYWVLAAFAVITAVICVLLIKVPKNIKTVVTKKKARGRQWEGITLQQALRRPYFYCAAVCVFLTGMSLQGIHGISGAHILDVGISSDYKTLVLTVTSLMLIFSKFLAGFGYDKLGLRITMLFCEVCGITAFLCLAFSANTDMGRALAMGYGVLAPLALPLETVVIPLIAADLFGEKEFSKLLGIFVGINTAGYAVGSPMCNLVFDRMQSYRPVLLALSILLVVVSIAFQFILNAAGNVRKQVQEQSTQNSDRA